MTNFSIIIPCYNSEQFIKVCIDSLLKLSYDENSFEVIIVDDCSTDNTVKTVENYIINKNLQIRLIKNPKNSGPGFSRRHAAEVANGNYLCFCDSDDWYDPNLLTDLEKEIKKNGSDLVIFDMSYILGSKTIRKNYTSKFKDGDRFTYLANCSESLCNLAIKRSLFLLIPPIDIRNGEDLALVPLLIVNAKKITHIDKSYYNYVIRSNSASLTKPTKESYYNMILAFDHIRKHLKSDKSSIISSIEFLGIKTVLYNSTLMAIKGGNNNYELSNIISDFSKKFPTWHKNTNRKNLGIPKRLYLWSLKHKLWVISRIYVALHSFILSRKI